MLTSQSGTTGGSCQAAAASRSAFFTTVAKSKLPGAGLAGAAGGLVGCFGRAGSPRTGAAARIARVARARLVRGMGWLRGAKRRSFTSRSGASSGRGGRRLDVGLVAEREEEGRPVAHPPLGPYAPAVAVDDALDDGEADP